GTDLVGGKSGDEISYCVRADVIRAFLIRMLGSKVLINATAEPAFDSATVAQILDLTSRLPRGDALVVQRESSRGAYPPIGRPAVTSVAVTPSEMTLTSVAAGFSPPEGGLKAAPTEKFPRSAPL